MIAPKLICIPASEFLMGSDLEEELTYDDEQPQHTVYLPEYHIARTPVTNAQYAPSVWAMDHRHPKHWEGGQPPGGRADHPVVNVSWHDALAYCRWLSEVTGKHYGLPSEAQWEKAARGDDGRIYPWGNGWDAGCCNSKEGHVEDTTPVGVYPQGASPYGLLDMAGNVWEWVSSLYYDYPYDDSDGRENPAAGRRRVLRGGAFDYLRRHARCAFRDVYDSSALLVYVGFRVVVRGG